MIFIQMETAHVWFFYETQILARESMRALSNIVMTLVYKIHEGPIN